MVQKSKQVFRIFVQDIIYDLWLPNLFYRTIMATKTASRPFSRWTIDSVHALGNLQAIESHPKLTEWLQSTTTFSPEETSYLRHHQEILLKKIVTWNEEDLKMKFIAHVLAAADIDSNDIGYRTFFEATLKAPVNGQNVVAKADMVVALGIAEPRQPFFFLQEYKRERGGDTDPLAQVLAAMLMAQTLNDYSHILYGCYIIGRNWFFLVLEDNKYAVSNAYNSSADDLFQIVAILRALKPRVEAALQSPKSAKTAA